VITHPATETSKGVRELHCKDCGEDFRVEIPETIFTDGLIYEEQMGYYVVVGIDRHVNPTATVISVPITYMGKKIVGIADNAFKGDTSITELKLFAEHADDGVHFNIGKSAFEGCSSLSKLTFDAGYISVSDAAFADCTLLSTFDGEDHAIFFGSYSFKNTAITELVLRYVDTIKENAFEGSKLSSLTITQQVSTIEARAFKNLDLTSLVITNAYINTIGDEAFMGTDITELIASGSSIHNVGDRAFAETPLVKVIAERSFIYLGAEVFANCTHLTEVNLGTSIYTIGNGKQ
jgi:hypothetical protein